MPDFNMIAQQENDDSLDLDFRVIYVETKQPGGPRPDGVGGGSCMGADCGSCPSLSGTDTLGG